MPPHGRSFLAIMHVDDRHPSRAYAWSGGRCARDAGLIGPLGQGSILIVDRIYDTDAIRDHATAYGAWTNVPASCHPKTIGSFSCCVY